MPRRRKRMGKPRKARKRRAPPGMPSVFLEVWLANPARLASGPVEVAALRATLGSSGKDARPSGATSGSSGKAARPGHPSGESTPKEPPEATRFHVCVRPKGGRPPAHARAADGREQAAAAGDVTPLEGRALAPEEAASALAAFAEGAIVATRNAPALRAAFPKAFDEGKILDLAALARAVRPMMVGFGPADIAGLAEGNEAGGAPGTPPSLEREAEITRGVWERLWEDAVALPLAALGQATWLLPPAGEALGRVLVRAEAARKALQREERAFKELFWERGEEIRAARRPRPLGEPQPLDEGTIDGLLQPGGEVAHALRSYEDRPQQRRMARAAALALSNGRHLLVEGGTGVGKSLAYLFPAVLWARRCNRPVVVSTHTKNLQSQLFEQDLPLVARALEEQGEFKAALIKGRRNYLCLRKLFYILRAAKWELDPAERVGMLSVLMWAVRTHTGDLAENNALQQAGPWTLFDKLTTTGDECMGRRCSAFGRCFLQAARARSLQADVVVANHALVFAELGLETPVLPEYEEVIFDEAQHVEDVATEHLAVRASRARVMRILVRLFRSGRRVHGTGLLATAFQYLYSAEEKLPGGLAALAHEAISRAAEAVRPVADAADEFFGEAAELLPPGGPVRRRRGRTRRPTRGERRHRYRKDGRDSEGWKRAFESGRALEGKLVELGGLVRGVVEVLGRPEAKGIYARRELAHDLRAQADKLQELAHDIPFVLAADAANYVHWVEEDVSPPGKGPTAALCAAPIQVAELLQAQLLDQKRSVICTSATLTVAGSFDFLAGRLGFDLSAEGGKAEALEVGSPFDYERQARAFVPRFLPDPRSGGAFVEGLSALLGDLFAASRGRGMALFTSYAMLDSVRDAIAPALDSRGVRVLAQGRDGSREAMLATLKGYSHTVLLGTSSFWEGVDVPGEALSVLVVARLPFHVFTEPIIEARCEALKSAGEDAFLAYTLPSAVLRLRQGTGRLIRTKSDRGVVVIADPRVVKTGYGRAFVESLPMRLGTSPDAKTLVRDAKAFLEGSSRDEGEGAPAARAGRAVLGEGAGVHPWDSDQADEEPSPFLD